MACRYGNSCGKLCPHFVVTTAVAFTDGNLVLTLPDTVTYGDREKFCIVIGQTVPAATTLNAPVVAVIGAGTEQFDVLRCGVPVVSQQVAVRTIYPVIVRTSTTTGSLNVLRELPRVDSTTLNSLNEAGDGA